MYADNKMPPGYKPLENDSGMLSLYVCVGPNMYADNKMPPGYKPLENDSGMLSHEASSVVGDPGCSQSK